MGCSDDFDGGVDEGEAAGGAGHGGVEPAEEVDGGIGFGGYVAHVDNTEGHWPPWALWHVTA